MAVNSAHIVASSWCHCVGIFNNRLFVCFQNGDCAHYQLSEQQSIIQLAFLLTAQSKGQYVNAFLGRGAFKQTGPEYGYDKIACPCAAILST